MTTPWGIELKEDIILVVDHDVLVIVSHDDLNGTFLFFGDRLRLDTWVDLAIQEVLDKSADIVMGDLLGLIIWEFLVFHSLLDREGWPFAVFEIQVACVSAKSLCVNGGKVDGTLVPLRERFQDICELAALLGRLSEDVCEW